MNKINLISIMGVPKPIQDNFWSMSRTITCMERSHTNDKINIGTKSQLMMSLKAYLLRRR